MTYNYIVNPTVVVPAKFNVADSSLRATLPQELYYRVLTRMSISGPSGSIFKLYQSNVDAQNLLDNTSRGASNTADYPNALPLAPGATVIGAWTRPSNPLTSADVASATFYVRQEK